MLGGGKQRRTMGMAGSALPPQHQHQQRFRGLKTFLLGLFALVIGLLVAARFHQFYTYVSVLGGGGDVAPISNVALVSKEFTVKDVFVNTKDSGSAAWDKKAFSSSAAKSANAAAANSTKREPLPVLGTKADAADEEFWSKREREITQRIMDVGHVFITFVSSSMSEFAFNWYYLAKDAGLDPIVVGALDDKMLLELRDAGVPSVSLNGTHTLGTQQES